MTQARSRMLIYLVGAGCLGACSSADETTDRSDFVARWNDSAEWCARQEECGISQSTECEEAWDTDDEVHSALNLTRWNSSDMARCERAIDEIEACFLSSPCEVGLEGCREEQQRLDLDCAALISALNADPATNEPVPQGVEAVTEAFCATAAQCPGGPSGAEEQRECNRLAAPLFSLLPDPDATVACLARSSCPDLMNDPERIVRECVDIDPRLTECRGPDVLHLCNSAGVCQDVDCQQVCGTISLEHVSCEFNAEDGYDKCLCAL